MLLQDASTSSNIDWFVNTFGGKDGWLLIGCGIMTLIWFLYEGYRKDGFLRPKKEEWEYDTVSTILKILIFSGIFLGLLSIATAIVSMVYKIPPCSNCPEFTSYDKLTSITLLILGMIMFIKPLVDLPWATLLGSIIGAGTVLAVVLLMPNEAVEYGTQEIDINLKWILLVIFLVIFSIVFTIVKLTLGWVEFLSKLIAWPPIALILSAFCFFQAIAVVGFGWSLTLL